MPDYKTPGVYVEETTKLPAAITSAATSIPAFIGYTEKAQSTNTDELYLKPFRIESLLQYEQYFGFPAPENGSITVVFDNSGSASQAVAQIDEKKRSKF